MLSSKDQTIHPSSALLLQRQEEAARQQKLQEQQQKITALKTSLSETEKTQEALAQTKEFIKNKISIEYITPPMRADHITLTIKRLFAVYFALWCETEKYSLSTLHEETIWFAGLVRDVLRDQERAAIIIKDVCTPLSKAHQSHPRYSNDHIRVPCLPKPNIIIEPANTQLRKLILIKECEKAIWAFLAEAARIRLPNVDDLAKPAKTVLASIEISPALCCFEILARIRAVIESYTQNQSTTALGSALTNTVNKFIATTSTVGGIDNSPVILAEKILLWIQHQGIFKELANKPQLSLKETLQSFDKDSRFGGYAIPRERIPMSGTDAEIVPVLRAILTERLQINSHFVDHLIQHLPQYAALSLVSKLTDLRTQHGFFLKDLSRTFSVTKTYSGSLEISIEIFFESQEHGLTPQLGVMSVSFLLNFHSSNIHYAEPKVIFFGSAIDHCHRVFLQTMLRNPENPLDVYVQQNLGSHTRREIPASPGTPGPGTDARSSSLAAVSPLSPDDARKGPSEVPRETTDENEDCPKFYDVHGYIMLKRQRPAQRRRQRNPNSGGSGSLFPSPVVSDGEE